MTETSRQRLSADASGSTAHRPFKTRTTVRSNSCTKTVQVTDGQYSRSSLARARSACGEGCGSQSDTSSSTVCRRRSRLSNPKNWSRYITTKSNAHRVVGGAFGWAAVREKNCTKWVGGVEWRAHGIINAVSYGLCAREHRKKKAVGGGRRTSRPTGKTSVPR